MTTAPATAAASTGTGQPTLGEVAVECMKRQKAAAESGASFDAAAAFDEHLWTSDAAIRAEFRNKEAFLAYRAGVRIGRIHGGQL